MGEASLSAEYPAHTGSDLMPVDLWRSNIGGGCSLADVGCLDAPLYVAAGNTCSVEVSWSLDAVWRVVVGVIRRGGV